MWGGRRPIPLVSRSLHTPKKGKSTCMHKPRSAVPLLVSLSLCAATKQKWEGKNYEDCQRSTVQYP